MSRSLSVSVHSQRFRLGLLTLVLSTGTPKDIVQHIDQQINPMNLIASGNHAGGHKAMALYIDGQGFDERDREIAISSDLVKAILGGYDTAKWNFLAMVGSSQDNNCDIAVGSALFRDNDASKTFVKDFARAIYGKGGILKGIDQESRTLLLFAPDTARIIFAWGWKTDRDTILTQPFGDKLTRYATAGNVLIAARAGSGQVKATSFEQIKAQIDGADIGDKDIWQATNLQAAQIDDITLGNQGDKKSYTVVMSGTFQGQYGLKVLNIGIDGGNVRLLPTSQPTIQVDEQVSQYGSPVRYDETSVTFVNRNGGKASVTRVPMKELPRKVRSVFTQQGAQAK